MTLHSFLFKAALSLTIIVPAGMPVSAADLSSALGGASAKDVAQSAMSDTAASALTVENFDPEVVNQLIDQAPIEAAQKDTLKQGVQAAADNPEMLQAALDKVKVAIGM